jgi:hypothetical protein
MYRQNLHPPPYSFIPNVTYIASVFCYLDVYKLAILCYFFPPLTQEPPVGQNRLIVEASQSR